MDTAENFYNDLDLKYPEIGICIEDIDRTDPGKRKFIIPVLTPNYSSSSEYTGKIHQNSANLENADKSNIEIGNIDVSNVVQIEIPKELCSLIEGDWKIIDPGTRSIVDLTNGTETITGANLAGSGSVIEGGSFNVSGHVSGGTLSVTNSDIEGVVHLFPTEEYRWIKKNSRWVIVFLGGDITKPAVIARLP